jgi:hypothetical protein
MSAADGISFSLGHDIRSTRSYLAPVLSRVYFAGSVGASRAGSGSFFESTEPVISARNFARGSE